jgi:hypothetical protein
MFARSLLTDALRTTASMDRLEHQNYLSKIAHRSYDCKEFNGGRREIFLIVILKIRHFSYIDSASK